MTPDELKQARHTIGQSQRGLADVLGVSRNTLNRWEMGMHPIPAPAANYLRHLLTCPTTQEPQP